MNARILELIRSPKLIQKADLRLLAQESEATPYSQAIRVLHLLGTHLYDSENYKQLLSTTAAYTTDKKILYHLINRESAPEKPDEAIEKSEDQFLKVPEVQPEVFSQEVHQSENERGPENKYTAIQAVVPPIPEPVLVGGELNRILFEGEEDFLEKQTQVIDIESTLESGKITLQKTSEENPVQPDEDARPLVEEVSEMENVPAEQVIQEENPASFGVVEEEPELSFHGLDEFLPEVKIAPASAGEAKFEAPKPQVNRHEEEMKRLIAEVEAKMKASKKEKALKVQPEEELVSSEINFAENHESPNVLNETAIPITEKAPEVEVSVQQQEIIPNETIPDPYWKPMNFESGTPDALISVPKNDTKAENKAEPNIQKPLQVEEKALNISFFNAEVKPIEAVKPVVEEKNESAGQEEYSSNVSGFITTWQNWLQIGRRKTEETEIRPAVPEEAEIKKEEPAIEDVKTKVIETFIETEPKISKLKEDSDFVVKEKTDDISHLMTETLARLYVEQKLYAKAIRAYEALALKHPQKADYFNGKIEETKDLRQNK